MTIYACVSVKGGAGKSTVSTNLAAEHLRRGSRVLLVDADPQGTARVWTEVAAENGVEAPTVVAMGREMHRAGQLDRVAAAFDVIVVDCPGRDGGVVRSALMVADVAVIPCGASPADAWALAQTLEVIEEAQTLRPDLKACVVVTRRRSTAIGKGARDDLVAAGVPVLEAELGERVAYQQAMGEGRGVTLLAPSSVAAREVRSLVDELIAISGDENVEEARIAHVA